MSEIDSISKLISENESEIEKIQDPDGPYDLSKKARQDMVEHLERSNDKLKALNTKLTKMSNELKGLEDELKTARDSHDRKKVREINKKISDKSSELKQMKKDARLDFKGYDSEGYNQGTMRDIVSCAFGQIGKHIHNFVYKEDTRHGDFAWKINKAIARFNLRHPFLGTLASGITFMSLSMLAVIAFGNPVIGMVASAVAIGRRIPQFVNGDSKLVRNYHIKKGGYKENIESSCAEYDNSRDMVKVINSIDIDNIHKKVTASGHDDTLGSNENSKGHKDLKEKLQAAIGIHGSIDLLYLKSLLVECKLNESLLDNEDKAKIREIENFILGNYGDLLRKFIIELDLDSIDRELAQLQSRKEGIEKDSQYILTEEMRNVVNAKLDEIREYKEELEKRRGLLARMSDAEREYLALLKDGDISQIDNEIASIRAIANDDLEKMKELNEDVRQGEELLSRLIPYEEYLLPEEKVFMVKIRELYEVGREKINSSKVASSQEKLRELVDKFSIDSCNRAIAINDRGAISQLKEDIKRILLEYEKAEKDINDSELLKKINKILYLLPKLAESMRENPFTVLERINIAGADSVDVQLVSSDSGYIGKSVHFRKKGGQFVGGAYSCDIYGQPLVFTSNDPDEVAKELDKYFAGFNGTVFVRQSNKRTR